MATATLALKSILNRKFTASLTIFSIALSVILLLGVERLRTDAKDSFSNTISGTDLIVGARSGAINLLLYSIFHIGDATNNISWKTYQEFANHPKVAWTIPISLGDSHRGFRVMGTNQDYFSHYHYARDRALEFSAGTPFSSVFDAVIGADVAEQLHYSVGQKMIVAHGGGNVALMTHADKPFTVVGILNKTGTPVDQTVHVTLEGIEAMHIDWRSGVPIPGLKINAEKAASMQLQPKVITAFLLGLKSRISTFHLQREINEYPEEPLLAILPGVTLQQLWSLLSVAEKALFAISFLVVLVGLTGMLTVILTSLNERRREMAILRSVGARPRHIFTIIMGEAGFLTLTGIATGVALFYIALFILQPVINAQYGLLISIGMLSNYELTLLAIILTAGIVIGAIPAYRAYRYSLADGMTIKV